jgi:hypothetical protein
MQAALANTKQQSRIHVSTAGSEDSKPETLLSRMGYVWFVLHAGHAYGCMLSCSTSTTCHWYRMAFCTAAHAQHKAQDSYFTNLLEAL